MNDDDDDVLFRLHVSAQLNRWKKISQKYAKVYFIIRRGFS